VAGALPFLNGFLNENGTALAATGKPLPVRFGTWFWGLGLTPGHSVKEQTATTKGIEFLSECEALIPYKELINFYGGFNAPLDGNGNYTHYSGFCASRTGTAASYDGDIPAPTLDMIVADHMSSRTRFPKIDVTSIGIPRENYSARSTNSRGVAEGSALNLYSRLFGSSFVDPNKAEFAPDPEIMVRHSVLSGMSEERKKLFLSLGAEDRARLDQYFTSIRQVENQLALQLEKPEPNLACKIPPKPAEDATVEAGAMEVENVVINHRIMANLLAMAVACNQTNVFNMVFSDNFSHMRKKGDASHHHQLTHEESVDQELGYQPLSYFFGKTSMNGLATYIQTILDIPEGDGSLLDNVLIYASTETNYARTHSIDGLPIFTIGQAGGRVKTGYHVVGGGDPITRVGFTAMQAMGVPLESWGTKTLNTSQAISEILV
jgi:hypothetical protein